MEHPLKNIEGYNVILASNSPRRKELLGQLGISFTTRILNDIDESFPAELKGAEAVQYICKAKADAYKPLLEDKTIAITADTVKGIKIPLPPIEEQKRIVQTMESLYAQLNNIEKSLG